MCINEEIVESIGYDSNTGVLIWLRDAIQGSTLKAGREISSKDAHGYIQINLRGKVLKGHRVAWFLHYGEWPNGQIDHINHDRSDNRIKNMGLAETKVKGLQLVGMFVQQVAQIACRCVAGGDGQKHRLGFSQINLAGLDLPVETFLFSGRENEISSPMIFDF